MLAVSYPRGGPHLDVNNSSASAYICVPLAAQGETLGVLYIEGRPSDSDAPSGNEQAEWESLKRIAIAAGERISLALGNLKLRQILRNQSIRDPLTGLFNRRYMEESLAREIHRAQRKKRTVSLVMLDLDHFKRFNNTFGHQAGDLLMQELATTLKSRVRACDIACRYGGEEFTLILSEADAEGASLCMQEIVSEVKRFQLRHRGQALDAVTISAGIAVYPDNGETAEELIRAADQALYLAKSQGRNRVVIARPVLA